jgi:hypothetical protein
METVMTEAKQALNIGDEMADGTILAAAKQLKATHQTAHVPTPKEPNQNHFENRNTGHLKSTSNTSGADPGSVYRSCESSRTHYPLVPWFDDGYQGRGYKYNRLPVRLVG